MTRGAVFEAISVGEPALRILETARKGVVQGSFRGAVNVLTADGLFCLVPEAAGRGPLNVNVRLGKRRTMSSLGVEVGDRVRVEGEVLDLGRALVSLASAERYAPSLRFARPVAPRAQVLENLEGARLTGLSSGNLSGLGRLLAAPKAKGRVLGVFAAAAARRIERLMATIREGDYWLAKRAVVDLIGLGPGLTPAGDDMLAGMAIFMSLYSRNSGMKAPGLEALEEGLRGSRGKTTVLSEALLRQAAAGRGSEGVLGLCEAVLTGTPDAVRLETKRLLRVGATSGTDTLLGIVLGGKLCFGSVARVEGWAW